jgi:hypothetical protein
MNQRIKQLWSQAGGHYDSGNQHTWPQYTIDNPEKFAELIVRECNHIIAKQAWESRTAGANGDWAEYNALSRVAGQIKEHFGVQE